MATVSDDDIIKRKLLIEGDGGTDDSRITRTLKMYLKWCQAPDSEESKLTCQRMLSNLAQCELSMEKSFLVYEMNTEQQAKYEELQTEIEKNITLAVDRIANCKSELQKAKRIRRNRQEYDALAKVIQQHPDRQQTLSQLQALDLELKSIKDTKRSLEKKLNLRKKQFHVFLTTLHALQTSVEADGDDGDDDDEDDDDEAEEEEVMDI